MNADWLGSLYLLGVVVFGSLVCGFLLTFGGMFGMEVYTWIKDRPYITQDLPEVKGVAGCTLCEEGEE